MPFLIFGAKTPNKTAYEKVQANLIEPLISALSPPLKPEASCTEVEFSHLLANSCLSPSDGSMDRSQLLKGLLEYIFEVASQEDSKDANRRKMYAICKANIDEDDDL